MAAITLVSCSGAPGVTTVALATTAALTATEVPEPVMVEMASSGGVIASQYDLPSEPGLASLVLALGAAPPDLLMHAQELPGGIPVVVAPPSNSKTEKLLEARAPLMADYLTDVDATVLVDGGRISSTTALRPVLDVSTLVAVVVHASRENFQLAATTIEELNAKLARPMPAGWVIVGACPWSHDEIVSQYGLPILSMVADDRIGAEAVAGLRRLRRRSPLARSVQSFADDIAKHLRVANPSAPLGYLEPDQPSADSAEDETYRSEERPGSYAEQTDPHAMQAKPTADDNEPPRLPTDDETSAEDEVPPPDDEVPPPDDEPTTSRTEASVK